MMMSMALTGCSSSTDTPAEAPAETPTETMTEDPTEMPAEKTVVKFAVQADSTEALNEIVKAFNAKSEMYEVEAIVMTNDSGNMHDQLMNSLSSQSGEYDIVSMDVVWAGEFAAAGYLKPLDSMIRDAGGWKSLILMQVLWHLVSIKVRTTFFHTSQI